ncbi:MAG: hypothetical protein IJY27_04380 [Clostridia bacterium]|nr:hypothetical protein [Clostridia bacterium]
MKVCIIQPPYGTDWSRTDEYFQKEVDLLNACDDSMDIIVMPESSDVPCKAPDREHYDISVAKNNAAILDLASKTAKRCNSMLFINANDTSFPGYRNTTYAFNRQGEIVGKYFKEHLTPGESFKRKLDSAYTFEFSEPTVIEMEGIRFGFLTCYDFYFYENFANMARQNLDVIIGCSHQRSDTHSALEIMTRFCAYNTNTYVLRSSVSMDENSDIGGASMVVAPNGDVLCNLGSRVGMECVDIDVTKKYYKPAGFGNPPAAHYEYVEKGRRPYKYRPAGSAIVKNDDLMPYPRTCSHRGFNTVAPENTLPAFGAAVAMGAEEIEFDLWYTKDGEIVSMHDRKLDRVSTGTGMVYDYTYEELLAFDYGVKKDPHFEGLRILKFEDILKKLACHTIMNIHVKSLAETNEAREPIPADGGIWTDENFMKIVKLIDKYDCADYVYFMGNDALLKQAGRLAPHIKRCVGGSRIPEKSWAIVDRAIAMGCEKVQFLKPYLSKELCDKAHEHNIMCNVFWSDDPEETVKFLEMGVDVILTNDYNRISQVVENYKKSLNK